MNMYRNSEGYSDPTAGEALSNIIKEERRKAVKKRKAATANNALSKNVEENKSVRNRSLSTAGQCDCYPRSEGLSEDAALAEKEPEEH